MSEFKFVEPRRKRRCRESRRPSLPVPVASQLCRPVQANDWPVYYGLLAGQAVLINDCQHAEALQQGFFGNSNIPRHRPRTFDSSSKSQTTSETEAEPKNELELVLRLSLEEAFFLSFGIGCLVVNENDKVFNLDELYERFKELDPLFSSRYIVYHYYRSLGWIVKSGIKFGVDYILYKEGPPFYHASYSVRIVMPKNDSSESRLSWSSLAGLNRLCERVAKELILCYVSERLLPESTSEQTLNDKVFKFKLEPQLIRRWVATEERDGEDDL